jgi:hypothetical protein
VIGSCNVLTCFERDESMHWIGPDRINQLLSYPALVAFLEEAHRQDVDAMDDLWLSPSEFGGPPNHFLVRAA